MVEENYMQKKHNVRLSYLAQKNAFTMIELILAIVVISISILALPSILQRDASNQEDSLAQEGILVTSAKISQILTFPWDAQSVPAGGAFSNSEVLNVHTSGDNELDRNTTLFRIGHFQDDLRRRMTPVAFQRSASAIPTSAAASPTNIADFNDPNPQNAIESGTLTHSDSYKKQYRFVQTIGYVDDDATYSDNTISDFDFLVGTQTQTSNIKMVQVTTQQLDETDPATPVWNTIVLLRSYACNIGETEFYKRRY